MIIIYNKNNNNKNNNHNNNIDNNNDNSNNNSKNDNSNNDSEIIHVYSSISITASEEKQFCSLRRRNS